MGKKIAGKVFYGLVCLLAAVLLVVSGYAHKVVGLTTMLEKGISIPGVSAVGTAGTVGAMNLGAAQSLAFVRSRDTLPGVDLGRTKRQQAVLDYLIYELKHEGVFTVTGKLDSLLSSASQYLITDSTFNLLDFATDMRGLSGSNVSFQTLPFTPENNVSVPGYPTLQDVNIIDVPVIQQLVQSTFFPGPVGPASGAATPSASATLGTGASTAAQQIAIQFGTAATALSTLSPGHVEVLIGSTVIQVPAGIAPPGSPPSASTQSIGAQVIGAGGAASPSATPTPSSTASTDGSGTGGAVTVAPNAPYGIPCVY